VTRRGLWIAAALLCVSPLDARSDEASGDTVVIQDASGRVIVVPAKASANPPKRVVPVKPTAPAARMPLPAPAPARPAAPAREGVGACEAHDDLVESWLDARKRVIAAQQELEAAESIPFTGVNGYRDSRIAGAERQLENAEARESEIDTSARNLGVPPSCFDDSNLPASDE